MKHTNNRITRYRQKRKQELFLVGCEQDARRKKKEAAAKRARLEKPLLERLEARRAGI